MGLRTPRSTGARATIAVVALYAFVLQAFLTGMLPAGGAQAHGFAELCAPVQDGGGIPGKKHDAKGCCTAACTPLALPLPQTDAAVLAWSHRQASVVAFGEWRAPPARGPPIHDHSARGPPAA